LVEIQPELQFFANGFLRNLKTQLQADGVDTDKLRKIIADQFFTFDCRGIMTSCEEWVVAEKSNRVTEPVNYRSQMALRVETSYLRAIYVLENWETVYNLGLNNFGVDQGIFDVEGDDEELIRLIQLNNAVEMLSQYSSLILPHILEVTLSGENLNWPDGQEDFKEWVVEHHGTIYLLETYLGMLLSYENADKLGLEISEETVQKELAFRLKLYKNRLNSCQANLPSTCIPLKVSETYTDFILSEVRDDLYKSKALRIDHPITPHVMKLRFYKQYGFEGQRCDVREIYRWVRMRNLAEPTPEGEAFAAEEEARLRSELSDMRESVLSEGTESFFEFAMIENALAPQQRRAGLRGDKGLDLKPELRELEVGELSPVMNGTPNTVDLYVLANQVRTNRIYHSITKSLPSANLDVVRYQKGRGEAIAELERLKALIEEGASIDVLAEEHSDNYDRAKGDISTIYPSEYGFAFAKEINAIPDGGLNVMSRPYGVHLVQVLSRVVTFSSDEIRAEISQEYADELAEQSKRYVLAKKLLYEANPYFK